MSKRFGYSYGLLFTRDEDHSADWAVVRNAGATDAALTTNLTTATVAANVTSYAGTGLAANTTYPFRVRSTNASGDSANSNVATSTTVGAKLTGVVIGTPGSDNNAASTIAKVFDGSLTTFFDAPTASGAWAGLDLGSAKSISSVKFAPRPGGGAYPGRMVGGKFQVSNTADFSAGVVTLHTIAVAPTTGVLTAVGVNPGGTYRYVRYLSAPNGWCSVSEMEVWS